MAISGKHDPNAGANRTPAPRLSRNEGGVGYGQGNDATASSLPPGQALTTQLGANLRSSVSDPVLAHVQAGGVRVDEGWQTRTVSAVPLKPANKGASTGPKILGAVIDNAADPVRKP